MFNLQQTVLMAQEFISVHGKLMIEREKLFIRTLLMPSFTETIFFIAVGFLSISLFLARFFAESDWDLFKSIVIALVIVLPRISVLYDVLMKRSFSYRIPLSKIKSYEALPDNLGLETILKLHLSSGRYRSIRFRTLEKQIEPLTEAIEKHQSQLQLT